MLKSVYSSKVKNIYLNARKKKNTGKILKFIFLETIIIVIIISAFINFKFNRTLHYQEPAKEEIQENYFNYLEEINLIKASLNNTYPYETDIRDIKNVILDNIYRKLIPLWYGTPWDFHGTAEYPHSGSIACGYFVTTILRDAGFNIERNRLAQQPSELIIKSLVSEDNIKRFSNTDIKTFLSAVREWGCGMYIAGLDNHVGFIFYIDNEIFFIHSTFRFPYGVVKEKALNAAVLVSSDYRVLGNILNDASLIRKWLNNEKIDTLIINNN
jgi:hypothetical protein